MGDELDQLYTIFGLYFFFGDFIYIFHFPIFFFELK